MSKRFYSYPLSFEDNGIKIDNSDTGLEVSRVLSVILTHKNERVLRPEYGNNITLFDNTADITPLLYEGKDISLELFFDKLLQYIITVI